MSMTKAGDRDTGEEIDVDISIGVSERGAFAVIDRDTRKQRYALASGCDIGLLLLEDFARLRSWNFSCYRRKFSG